MVKFPEIPNFEDGRMNGKKFGIFKEYQSFLETSSGYPKHNATYVYYNF